jgi:hypothetical protein
VIRHEFAADDAHTIPAETEAYSPIRDDETRSAA